MITQETKTMNAKEEKNDKESLELGFVPIATTDSGTSLNGGCFECFKICDCWCDWG